MSMFEELKGLFEDFRSANDGRLNEMEKKFENRIDDIETSKNRTGLAGGNSTSNSGRMYLNVNGEKSPIIACSEKISAFSRNADHDPFSISDYVRQGMGLKPQNAVVSGPALVPVQTSADIIDMVRAAATIIQAGAGTIMIDGPTNLARVTGDATVYQHTEGADDIVESDITFDAVSCNPKALVALVPLSAEVVSDSANLDAMLNMSLAGAFAAKLDALCLATILANASIPKSAVAHDPKTWTGTMLAIAAALGLNQQLPVAHIANAADFMTRSGILASTSGAWLGAPPVLANMLQLYTSKLTAGLSIFGNFAEAFAIISRQNLNLEIVRFAKSTKYTHILVAHARMDGVVLQPGKLYNQKLTP